MDPPFRRPFDLMAGDEKSTNLIFILVGDRTSGNLT